MAYDCARFNYDYNQSALDLLKECAMPNLAYNEVAFEADHLFKLCAGDLEIRACQEIFNKVITPHYATSIKKVNFNKHREEGAIVLLYRRQR
jgi:hypothetical protein